MKIMHVADVHVESAYIKPGKQKSALLRDESVQRFADIVNEAKKQKVDVMLICGDLFDRTVVRKSTIKFVLSQIAQNKNIRFFSHASGMARLKSRSQEQIKGHVDGDK